MNIAEIQTLKSSAMDIARSLQGFLVFVIGFFILLTIIIASIGTFRFQFQSGANLLFLVSPLTTGIGMIVGFFLIHRMLGDFSNGLFFSTTNARRIRFLAWIAVAILVADTVPQVATGRVFVNGVAAITPFVLFPIARIWRYEAERQASLMTEITD
jgi:hypothetical protein